MIFAARFAPRSARGIRRAAGVATLSLVAAGSLALPGGPSASAATGVRSGPTASEPTTVGEQQRPAGAVVKVERLNPSLWLPGTGTAYRVHYVSFGHDGRRHLVTGTVFIPPSPAPDGGRPVISWAHGTVGAADACTPSVAPRSERDSDYLGGWLAAGYAVVATDDEGLGTRQDHPYLDGRSEAYNVIDMVRAARQVDASLSRRWIAVGQSQGAQAALFAGALDRGYGRGLDFRGSVATAPPSQWRMLFEILDPFRPDAPTNPFLPLVLAGMQIATDGRLRVADYLTPAGAALVGHARDDACLSQLIALTSGTTAGTFFSVDARERERLARILERRAEIPIRRYSAPVFIAQGSADLVVSPQATAITAERLRTTGTDVAFHVYPGADHSGVMAAALPDALAWAASRLRERLGSSK